MKKILGIVILFLLLSGNVYASTVSKYLQLGYKLHSVNLSNDASALIYHLVLDLKKEKKTLLDLKKNRKSSIITCIVNFKTGKTAKCYKPD
tara:strand:+ start:254 stop:526 length:273 start_codon:yes stop_codon:yes gene_type:complete